VGSVEGWVYQMGDGDHQRERGSFGSQFAASHCNQWALYCIVVSCVEVHKPTKLSFGVVSGVSLGAPRGRVVSGVFRPIGLNGVF